MAKKETYKDKIRKQVKQNLKTDKVPEYLDLTIENYAKTLEMRDLYAKQVVEVGPLINEVGSMGQPIRKQNPICSLLYQQEQLCLQYAKALGFTAAKAAAKTDPQSGNDDNPMDKLAEALK